MSSKRLRLVSPSLYALERLFAGLQHLSLAIILFGVPKEDLMAEATTSVQRVKMTIRRGRKIEAYVVAWLVVQLVVICVLSTIRLSSALAWPIRTILAYRLFDITQAVANLNVFSSLRMHGRPRRVPSLARILILSLWSFVEVAFCFGGLYATAPSAFSAPFTTFYDPYYFSMVTQLTIGYGDIFPIGAMRLLVATQGMFGFMLGAIVLGRIVSLLPRVEPLLRGN